MNGNVFKRRRFTVPFFFLLLCAGLVYGYWTLFLRGAVSTDDATIDGDPVSISSKIPGRIISLACAEGDSVKQGEKLAQIDDSDLRAQEAQAQAALELSRQSVTLADVNVKKAQEDFDRADTQFHSAVVPQEQYDHAKKALELAQAQAKVSQAQVTSAGAELEVVQTQLKNTEIWAPASGVVARKWIVPGDVVAPGQPIYTIYDLRDLWVTANFEETKLSSIHVGESAEISVDALRGRKLGGRVILIGAAAASEFSLIPPNNASGNFTKVTQRVPIRIGLDDPEGLCLLPGMSVEVRILVKR